MPLALVETGHCNVDLKPSPIKPHWILEGNPEAREHVLSTSACGTTKTIIWSCTEGKFNWYYDVDETIMILEGSIVLESNGMPPRRYGVGDVILFREGACVKWHVEGHVRKIAFFRQTIPFGLGYAVRAINKLKQILFAPGGRPSARQPGSVQSSNSTATAATYDVAPARFSWRRKTHNVN
ncbi:cupin [Bradyrhizobium sp. CCBAU 051011]|nr:cupin [Bradyrhizobium sp. CCBAU 051011]